MLSKTTRFILCAAGIFITFFLFGILLEKITRGKYSYEVTDSNGEKTVVTEQFTYTLALVFIQCFINYLFAKGMLYYWPQGEDKTPWYYYGGSSLMYLLAMVCSNMALQWVPYPTQVVGKSAKPIPVMILGVLVGKKEYPLKKYLFVTVIVTGVVLFMYKENASVSQPTNKFGLGELLLILSLIMDGLLGAFQERIKTEAHPSGQQMMRAMNMWASILVAGPLVGSKEVFTFVEFVTRHPSVLSNIALLSLCCAIGQLFIFLMVSEFGPLPCSIVTTTRKFFTVLASVVIFGNILTGKQWIGALLVFAGLFLDAFLSKSPTKNHRRNTICKS